MQGWDDQELLQDAHVPAGVTQETVEGIIGARKAGMPLLILHLHCPVRWCGSPIAKTSSNHIPRVGDAGMWPFVGEAGDS